MNIKTANSIARSLRNSSTAEIIRAARSFDFFKESDDEIVEQVQAAMLRLKASRMAAYKAARTRSANRAATLKDIEAEINRLGEDWRQIVNGRLAVESPGNVLARLRLIPNHCRAE